ncbi:MAG: cytidylate kinase-like family protein [Eubacteriales bacterium]|nr:cytidylate kinase-like family protein [Eubacteriales bacterium]
MKIITISRQYGSGGREVADLLSKKMGIPFFDGNLLLIAGERYGINPGLFKEYDEKKNTSFLYNIAMIADGYTSEERVMMPYKLYQAQMDTMKKLVQDGPCIFVGRCADWILRDECELVRVFIYASSMEQRIQRIMEVDKVSRRDAPSRINRKDRDRKDYYYFHTGQEWGKLTNYDLCLNTTTLGYEGCAEIIRSIAEK